MLNISCTENNPQDTIHKNENPLCLHTFFLLIPFMRLFILEFFLLEIFFFILRSDSNKSQTMNLFYLLFLFTEVFLSFSYYLFSLFKYNFLIFHTLNCTEFNISLFYFYFVFSFHLHFIFLL